MTIQFTELAGDIKVPTVAVETDYDSGRQALPGLGKKLLILAYGLAAGDASDGELHEITSLAQAIDRWGIGSQMAVMVEAALKVRSRLSIYGMSFSENGAAAAATATVTVAGTATGPGTLKVYVSGKLFQVGIQNGDTATAIGDLLEAAIDAHHNLPATSANVAGVVTVTARNGGPEGNSIGLRCEVNAPGITATASATHLAAGATAGDPTTALAGIEGHRFHVVALGTDDSTAAGALGTHMEKQSEPAIQKWGMGVLASVGTATAAKAVATAIDSYRMQIAWHQASDEPVFELAAALAAERAFISNRNQTLDGHELPGISAQSDRTMWPVTSDEESCLGGGVTPLRPTASGGVEVVRSIHSRVTSPAFIDHNPLEISDYIDEDLINIFKLRYKDAALKVSSPAATTNVLTPSRAKLVLHERMRIWDTILDYTQGAETDIKGKKTKADPNATDVNRLDVAYPFRPVFGAHVIAVLKTFTTPDIL